MRQVTKLVKRTPEEELMDLPAHAQAYANADFSEPNSKFVALFSEKFPGFNRQLARKSFSIALWPIESIFENGTSAGKKIP